MTCPGGPGPVVLTGGTKHQVRGMVSNPTLPKHGFNKKNIAMHSNHEALFLTVEAGKLYESLKSLRGTST